jgi:hypothetical protein
LRNSGGSAPHSAAQTIDDSTISPCRGTGRRKREDPPHRRPLDLRELRKIARVDLVFLRGDLGTASALLDAELRLQRHRAFR